jgi:hypothetical protein
MKVNALNQSGKTDLDKFQDAIEMYSHCEKHQFKLERCYEVLRKSVKWQAISEDIDRKPKGRKKRDPIRVDPREVDHLRDIEVLEDYNDLESEEETGSKKRALNPTALSKRPSGVKRVKTDVMSLHANQSMARSSSQLVTTQKERNAILERSVDVEERKLHMELFLKRDDEVLWSYILATMYDLLLYLCFIRYHVMHESLYHC